MDSVLCIPGNKMPSSLRGIVHWAWASVNKAGLPLLFMLFLYSGPCVLAPVFIEATKTPTINTLLRMWGHSNVTSQGASSLESLDDQQTGVVGGWVLGRGLEEEVWPTRTPGSMMSLSWCLSYCWWVCIAIISQTCWLKRSNLCSYSHDLINYEMGQNEAL